MKKQQPQPREKQLLLSSARQDRQAQALALFALGEAGKTRSRREIEAWAQSSRETSASARGTREKPGTGVTKAPSASNVKYWIGVLPVGALSSVPPEQSLSDV